MLRNDRKRRTDFLIASAMLGAGLLLSGYSLVAVARSNVHLAQATQRLLVAVEINKAHVPTLTRKYETDPTAAFGDLSVHGDLRRKAAILPSLLSALSAVRLQEFAYASWPEFPVRPR